MTKKSVQTRTVFSEMTLSQNRKNFLRKQNHPILHASKLKLSQKNNIITARFYGSGVTKPSFLKEVQSYKFHIEEVFGTTVEYENTQFGHTLKVKRTSESGHVLVNFVYVSREVTSMEPNEGVKYESDMITKLSNAGYTTQTSAEEQDGVDISLNVNGKTAGVELKENINAVFGSGTLVFRNNKWEVSQRSSSVIRSLVRDHLSAWINKKWYEETNGYIPNPTATKEDQEVLGGGTGYYIPISSNVVSDYYSKSDYIQIKGKGFYKLHNKNPLNIKNNKISNFNPRSSKARIRVKNIGGNRYVYKIELYLGEISPSVNNTGLDGDIKFLEG